VLVFGDDDDAQSPPRRRHGRGETGGRGIPDDEVRIIGSDR
jgi:hypothetical protein